MAKTTTSLELTTDKPYAFDTSAFDLLGNSKDGNKMIATDASAVGLKPGEWPFAFSINRADSPSSPDSFMGRYHFVREDIRGAREPELFAVVYLDPAKKIEAHIIND